MFLVTDLLRKKRFGKDLSFDEWQWFIDQYLIDDIKDYQASALLMAICLNGMTERETADLTRIMRDSGRAFQFPHVRKFIVDKHSTGGVGDKTSLIIAPLVAAAGLAVPMIAGRGLAHTGGTLDKLESIPGFRVDLPPERFSELVGSLGFSIMGQTKDMCPADKKLYSLRDVTGTVDSQPLICASIMSKKLAEGLNGLVLDVKFGSGAFMKSLAEAEALATALKKIGESAGLKVRAVLSNMNQPLGCFAGNGLEVIECLEILRGQTKTIDGVDFYDDTRELSLKLSAHMIQMANPSQPFSKCFSLATDILISGKAYENFERLCLAQGAGLPKAFHCPAPRTAVPAMHSGYVTAIDTEKLGLACVELGAGRTTSDQSVDPWAGIEMAVKLNHSVDQGQPLVYIYGKTALQKQAAARLIYEAIDIQSEPATSWPLIAKVI